MSVRFLEVVYIFPDQSQNAYFTALSIVAESNVPMGAWQLRRALAQRGVQASEATCGRLLRTMEDAGHVEARGRKGRSITARGERVLKEWREKQARDRTQVALVESLSIQNHGELLEVLIARRAIESETAALAAERATPEEIEALRQAISEQQAMLDSGSSAIDQNAAFHLGLARAAKNRVLIAALELIYGHPDVMRAFEYIRAKVGSEMVEDHRRIIHAVARRSPAASRRAMEKHMTNVIEDVAKYLRESGEREGLQDGGERQDPGRV